MKLETYINKKMQKSGDKISKMWQDWWLWRPFYPFEKVKHDVIDEMEKTSKEIYCKFKESQ